MIRMNQKRSHSKHKNNTAIHFNFLDWLCIAISLAVSIVVIFFYHENSPFYTFVSVVALNGGVLGTILSIKGRRSNFIIAFIEAFACFYTSWANHFIGNALINILFYAPATIIGFHSWGKHSGRDKKVIARKFTPIQAIIAIAIFVATTILLNLILVALGGAYTIIDSAATILIIFATILAVLRFREQWLAWLLSDILQLIMWTTTNDPAILALRIFFPLSAIYGYINWRKLIKPPRSKKH